MGKPLYWRLVPPAPEGYHLEVKEEWPARLLGKETVLATVYHRKNGDAYGDIVYQIIQRQDGTLYRKRIARDEREWC